MKLQIKQPGLWVYENGILCHSILGGLKTEGLDRMRVTLKVELSDSPRPAVRHNLDLYNDNQLEKFIRKVAERLEVGTSVVAAGLSDLTAELESYRLEMLKQQQISQPQAKCLSESERAWAIENLKATNLMEQTLISLQQSGIQGEEDNSMILYIAMTSRKTRDPLSVICLAKSGLGKSYLMEKVAECIPQEDTKEHTQFSGNSFYYYRREEIRGKIFLIEDLDGAQAVMFPIRELQTKKRISKTVTIKDKNGQLRTVTLIVEGPVCVIGCTTREKVYEDNANRALLIYLDSSKEQDERIMTYQKQHRAGLIDTRKEKHLQEKLRDMQRVLEPVKVINPYAMLLSLPKEIFKPRRTLPLLLSFIEAVAFYHQYQREQKANNSTGEIYIEVHPQDIAQSFKLLQDVLFRKSDELSGATRAFYQYLKQWNRDNQKKQFYASNIRQGCPITGVNRIHPRTLNRYLQELTDYGLLQITGGNKHRTGYRYEIMPNRDYESLQKSINAQIEKVMENVWTIYRQRQTEPSKETKVKQGKTVSKLLDTTANCQLNQLNISEKDIVGHNT